MSLGSSRPRLTYSLPSFSDASGQDRKVNRWKLGRPRLRYLNLQRFDVGGILVATC